MDSGVSQNNVKKENHALHEGAKHEGYEDKKLENN